MGNVKKTIGCLALTAIVSTSAFGMLSPAAQAVDGSIPYVADTMAYTNGMTLDVAVTPYLFEDTNGDGFTNAGDTVNYVLKVTNTSDKNYNYVDVSGFRMGLERLKIADSLKAGESLTKDLTYVIRTDDHLEAAVTGGGKVTVNVRDETQLESSRSEYLYINAELYECAKSTEIVDNLINYCIDGSNGISGTIESYNGSVVYDVATDKYYTSYADNAERFLEASGKVAEVVESHGVFIKPGNRIYSTITITNRSEEDFTIADVAHAYKLGENNVVGATVKVDETVVRYFSETVDVDSMDWELQTNVSSRTSTSLEVVGGGMITGNTGAAFSGVGSGVSNTIASAHKDNNDGTFDVVWTYTGRNTRETTIIPRAFVSERFGSFDITETFENGPIVKQMPTIENVPEYTVASEAGYLITYGKHFGSLVPQPRVESVFMGMSFVPTPELPIDPIEPVIPVDPIEPTPVDPVDPIIPITPIEPVVPVDPIEPVPVEIIIPELPIEPAPEAPVTTKFINTGEVSATSSSSENAGLIAMLVGGLATGALALAIASGRVFRKRRAAHRA